ncbi:MAG TPA: type II 3-dehydroquinate dehydratase [Clostridiales bacterium]|nr:type II 3-dehydroquinate dehydratase [Clostridiales bacterium]
MKKILILNGPNLNMLGVREPAVYGAQTLSDIEKTLRAEFEGKAELEFLQSNSEGAIIDAIQFSEADGIALNAGAYTHYSYAIHDAIKSIAAPVVEVHISNIYKREEFRHKSVIAAACTGSVCGFGADSYYLAITALLRKLEK